MENYKDIVTKRAFRNLVPNDEFQYNEPPKKRRVRRKNKELTDISSLFSELKKEYSSAVKKQEMNIALDKILGERLSKFSYVEEVKDSKVVVRCKNKTAYLNYKMQKNLFLENIRKNVPDLKVDDVLILPPKK